MAAERAFRLRDLFDHSVCIRRFGLAAGLERLPPKQAVRVGGNSKQGNRLESHFPIVSELPTIHEEIRRQHRRRLSEEAALKHSLNQKDFKSATTQAAPVTRKVRTHSDQLKCAFG